jgi:hypothetical protein
VVSQPIVKSAAVRGRDVRIDENGQVCLSDLWSAAGFKTNQGPAQWWRLQSTIKLAEALLERLVGLSPSAAKIKVKSVYYARKNGIFAHPILACAYAGYLSPKLEIEVREVFLRFKAADPVLADDILDRASPEANEWAGVRALGRATRGRYTSTLKSHGVAAPVDYALCTNETYLALFDGTAQELKRQRALKKSENLRDKMPINDLSFVMAAEALASERIDDLDCRGTPPCKEATRTSARFIREAIERDRADRRNNRQSSLGV